MSDEIRPFKIHIDDAELDDLKRRLGATRWPDAQTVGDWSQGIPLDYVRTVCDYWAHQYDWRKTEARLNALSQFQTEIDGVDIYFLHIRSSRSDALPLVLTHGWPGSIIEQLKIIGFTILISCIGTAIIGYALKFTIGLRPTAEQEEAGLDLSDHGEEGYIL